MEGKSIGPVVLTWLSASGDRRARECGQGGRLSVISRIDRRTVTHSPREIAPSQARDQSECCLSSRPRAHRRGGPSRRILLGSTRSGNQGSRCRREACSSVACVCGGGWKPRAGRDHHENLARRSLRSTILAFTSRMSKTTGRGHALLQEAFIMSSPCFVGPDDP